LTMVLNTIVDEVMELIAHEDYSDFTPLEEQSELYMEDFFLQYPKLKPSTREEVVTLKKSCVEYIKMEIEDQYKMIAGTPTKHKVLDAFIKGLKQNSKKEYRGLNNAEKRYLGGV
ncbi:hypothetical protein PENTCL1PPCAC_16365, partial [Pristionchus entomophagus]